MGEEEHLHHLVAEAEEGLHQWFQQELSRQEGVEVVGGEKENDQWEGGKRGGAQREEVRRKNHWKK